MLEPRLVGTFEGVLVQLVLQRFIHVDEVACMLVVDCVSDRHRSIQFILLHHHRISIETIINFAAHSEGLVTCFNGCHGVVLWMMLAFEASRMHVQHHRVGLKSLLGPEGFCHLLVNDPLFDNLSLFPDIHTV